MLPRTPFRWSRRLVASTIGSARKSHNTRLPCRTSVTAPVAFNNRGLFGRTMVTTAGSETSDKDMVVTLDSDMDWNDRKGLQERYSLVEKGWKVNVEWRMTPAGVGLFAAQDIAAGALMRVGLWGVNLRQFEGISDVQEFCDSGSSIDEEQAKESRQGRLAYVKDYLWGFHKQTDDHGYLMSPSTSSDPSSSVKTVYGMWMPGNGLNHSTSPNMVYREGAGGINLMALRDIAQDEEIFDDYRRHGSAPDWLVQFAQDEQVTLNFAGCNDFV